METNTERNCRVQKLYDELMAEGKHGHYETMFRIVRLEVEAEREACAKACEAIGPELIRWWGDGQANAAAQECATVIRMRSNVQGNRPGAALCDRSGSPQG